MVFYRCDNIVQQFISKGITCGTQTCTKNQNCCLNLTCTQKCLGQAPTEDQQFCNANCSNTLRCQCRNGGMFCYSFILYHNDTQYFIYSDPKGLLFSFYFIPLCVLQNSCNSRPWSIAYLQM